MPSRSRYESAIGSKPDLVPVSYGTHLIQWLWQCGPVMPSGDPVTWSEIESWAKSTGRTLTRWEAETLRAMSEQYATMRRRASDPQCPAPWLTIKVDSTALSQHILTTFRSITKKG